jgi:hypothetical protein
MHSLHLARTLVFAGCYRSMSGSDKEAILIRVSEFLSKSVGDLADALNEIAKQVTEFQQSLNKIRSDLKTAQVTPMASATLPLLSTESGASLPSGSLFDFVEGEEPAMATTEEDAGLAEAILLGEDFGVAAAPAPSAPAPSRPPTGPPKGPPTGPPTAQPAAPFMGPPMGPPTTPPAAKPAVPPAAPPAAPAGPPKAFPTPAPTAKPAGPPTVARPVAAPTAAAMPPPVPVAAAPAAPGAPKVGEGIAGLRSEMMAEIKRIKEIFES